MSRAKKVLTDEEKKRAQDKRLKRTYNISLADRDERIRQQAGKCKICGGPLDPPCVDHFHFYTLAERNTSTALLALDLKWRASTFNERRELLFTHHGFTKKTTIASVKRWTLPWSVRGILCSKCNRGLGYIERFFDAARIPENLLPVLSYLRARLNP